MSPFFTSTRNAKDAKKYGHNRHQPLKINTEQNISLYANFNVNGHVRYFGRPYWTEEINE